MAKKNFNLENPAMQFISTGAEAVKKEEAETIAPAPEGFKINPLYLEKKSRRLQLLMKPSIYEKLKARADREGNSVNDVVNNLIEEALKGE